MNEFSAVPAEEQAGVEGGYKPKPPPDPQELIRQILKALGLPVK
jgi:hypothetical protein